MTKLEEGCKAAIMSYANEEMQRNAALLGEHSDYVTMVLTILRDLYRSQKEDGATEFVVPVELEQYLDSMKPF